MTHGAISRQVAAFETWLGVQVFQRRGKRVRLTDGGRRYLSALQAAVDGLGVALGPLPLLADELLSGRLVVPLAGPRIDARGYWWVARREVAHAPLVEQFCEWQQAQGDQTQENETGSVEATR
ncbi:protein of unknown function [Paraburkholderia dioscoreae]|uniref:HTH lysR-type domain-containing protein n=1 Tax=Paraburkholderia dioscoreae TaxID=2604047 RepID=A0A5Q4YX14_9BURK|nr:protein of unknown function [Paraburkholderia dioscoreae]